MVYDQLPRCTYSISPIKYVADRRPLCARGAAHCRLNLVLICVPCSFPEQRQLHQDDILHALATSTKLNLWHNKASQTMTLPMTDGHLSFMLFLHERVGDLLHA